MSTKKKQSWFKRTVVVGENYIIKGYKIRGANREENCPVALALRGLKLRGVEVFEETARAVKGGKEYIAQLPKRVTKFIKAFDSSKDRSPKVKALTFQIKFVHEEE